MTSRPEYSQLKLRLSSEVKDLIERKAEENLISVNAMAVQLLQNALLGKPRYRIKMGRATL